MLLVDRFGGRGDIVGVAIEVASHLYLRKPFLRMVSLQDKSAA